MYRNHATHSSGTSAEKRKNAMSLSDEFPKNVKNPIKFESLSAAFSGRCTFVVVAMCKNIDASMKNSRHDRNFFHDFRYG